MHMSFVAFITYRIVIVMFLYMCHDALIRSFLV